MQTSQNRVLATHTGSLPCPPELVLPFANPRHAHEYAVLNDVPLDPDQLVVAGVIDSVTHPIGHQTIGECIERAAEDVVRAKLAALSEGARIASERLF